MAEKRIPVTEAAQRVVDAVEEVVSNVLRGNTIRSGLTTHCAADISRKSGASARSVKYCDVSQTYVT